MQEERVAKIFEFSTEDTTLTASLILKVMHRGPGPENETGEPKTNIKLVKEGPNNETRVNEPSDSMTDAQKRFLFRLLAQQGIDGDKAYEYLQNFFNVTALKEVSKAQASQAIEHLLEAAKEGERS